RIPFANPVGQLVFALTDWLVMPLRRVIPPTGRWDLSSLAAALVLQLLQYFLLWLALGAGAAWAWLPWLALFGLVRVAMSGVIGLLLMFTVLSWVQTRSPLAQVMERLCEPVLRPFRRIIPLVGGVDLAPLAALVALQVAMMVLGHLQAAVLQGF
ncbi:MAG: YggT family protein, partial [Burkholderiaceae bacterium]|nr:YggT family protein [Burkholderiaceae bacterium]